MLTPLAETWTEVWGDEIFLAVPTPPNVKFGGGDGGGLTVFVNFNI